MDQRFFAGILKASDNKDSKMESYIGCLASCPLTREPPGRDGAAAAGGGTGIYLAFLLEEIKLSSVIQ